MATGKKSTTAIDSGNLLSSRLTGLCLAEKKPTGPSELLHMLGAMQAQHLEMSFWAVGLRLNEVSVADIESSIAKGRIVRTHVLRPTWHWVAAEDMLWMLSLTAPSIKNALFSRDKALGIEEKEYVVSDKMIVRILEDQPCLSKKALSDELTARGLPMDEYRSNHYIMHAELEGIICSGPILKGKHSYALAENMLGVRLEKAQKLKKQFVGPTAVRELARRYFSTRGPATIEDFRWWSGLGITVIKETIKSLTPDLQSYKEGSETLYFYPSDKRQTAATNQLQFLPAFDEYLISFKDRKRMLEQKYNQLVITSNGIFRPCVLDKGKVVATWQVEKGRKGLKISVQPFENLNATRLKVLQAATEEMAIFYGRFRESAIESIKFAL